MCSREIEMSRKKCPEFNFNSIDPTASTSTAITEKLPGNFESSAFDSQQSLKKCNHICISDSQRKHDRFSPTVKQIQLCEPKRTSKLQFQFSNPINCESVLEEKQSSRSENYWDSGNRETSEENNAATLKKYTDESYRTTDFIHSSIMPECSNKACLLSNEENYIISGTSVSSRKSYGKEESPTASDYEKEEWKNLETSTVDLHSSDGLKESRKIPVYSISHEISDISNVSADNGGYSSSKSIFSERSVEESLAKRWNDYKFICNTKIWAVKRESNLKDNSLFDVDSGICSESENRSFEKDVLCFSGKESEIIHSHLLEHKEMPVENQSCPISKPVTCVNNQSQNISIENNNTELGATKLLNDEAIIFETKSSESDNAVSLMRNSVFKSNESSISLKNASFLNRNNEMEVTTDENNNEIGLLKTKKAKLNGDVSNNFRSKRFFKESNQAHSSSATTSRIKSGTTHNNTITGNEASFEKDFSETIEIRNLEATYYGMDLGYNSAKDTTSYKNANPCDIKERFNPNISANYENPGSEEALNKNPKDSIARIEDSRSERFQNSWGKNILLCCKNFLGISLTHEIMSPVNEVPLKNETNANIHTGDVERVLNKHIFSFKNTEQTGNQKTIVQRCVESSERETIKKTEPGCVEREKVCFLEKNSSSTTANGVEIEKCKEKSNHQFNSERSMIEREEIATEEYPKSDIEYHENGGITEISKIEPMELDENFAVSTPTINPDPKINKKSCIENKINCLWTASVTGSSFDGRRFENINSRKPREMGENFEDEQSAINPVEKLNQEISDTEKNSCLEDKLKNFCEISPFGESSKNTDYNRNIQISKSKRFSARSNIITINNEESNFDIRRKNLAVNESRHILSEPVADISFLLDLFDLNNDVTKRILLALLGDFYKTGVTQTLVLEHLKSDLISGTVAELKEIVNKFFKTALKGNIIEMKNRRYFLKSIEEREREMLLKIHGVKMVSTPENSSNRELRNATVLQGKSLLIKNKDNVKQTKTPIKRSNEKFQELKVAPKSIHRVVLKSPEKQKIQKLARR